MQAELESLDTNRIWDVAVVGSGPAGMTVAIALARLGREVLLLEGGDRYYDDASQRQYKGEVEGDHYFSLDECRMRMLGGTSVHWTGWTRPFEAEDFDRRDIDSMAWWQIGAADLRPYQRTATKMLHVEDDYWTKPFGSGLATFNFQFSADPTRFGEAYWDELNSAKRITLALGSNLVGIDTDGTGVTGLTMANTKGLRRKVRARAYVMACGGIENSRLLMHFNAETQGRLIKQPQTLGRYWMEHPHYTIGYGFVPKYPGQHLFLSFEPAELRRRGLLNCGLRIHQTAHEGWLDMLTDLACVAPETAQKAFRKLQIEATCETMLRAAWEMLPRAVNRVELNAAARDDLGIPRVTLHYQISDADHANMRELVLGYGAHLAKNGLGRLKLEPWTLGEAEFPKDDEIAGYHHMGGTRMSDRPETGIVDKNLKVFGLSNLFMAGSSVFPTASHVNPTLTIVQLSLRLADHLNRRALA
jgi:choline dehydrogenase-like flavoprotein